MGKNHSDGNVAEQFPRRELKTESLSKVKFFVEEAECGFWAYLQRSAGKLPEDPLHKVMNWLLEQLNLGNGEIELDPRGDGVSLVIGRRAAAEHQPSAEQASKDAERRLLAVYQAQRINCGAVSTRVYTGAEIEGIKRSLGSRFKVRRGRPADTRSALSPKLRTAESTERQRLASKLAGEFGLHAFGQVGRIHKDELGCSYSSVSSGWMRHIGARSKTDYS